MEKSLVSVIIPYYNSEKTIIRALNSVVNQVYKNFEIILIDDGSTDNSHELVENFIANNTNIKFLHIYQENSGPSKARNQGIKKACGKYISFLDSDDSWVETKLQEQVKFMDENLNIVVLGTDYIIYGENTLNTLEKKKKFEEANFFKMLLKHFFITPTVLIRRDILKNNMIFDVNKKYTEDTLLYLKLCRKYRGGKICKPLTIVYKPIYGSSGLSKNLLLTEKNELQNFILLYHENYKETKKVSFYYLIIAIVFSIIKFIRRILICLIRKGKE